MGGSASASTAGRTPASSPTDAKKTTVKGKRNPKDYITLDVPCQGVNLRFAGSPGMDVAETNRMVARILVSLLLLRIHSVYLKL